MSYKDAYLTIVKASVEQDTKEIPMILEAVDFKDKNVSKLVAAHSQD